jgi:hypothetical protein
MFFKYFKIKKAKNAIFQILILVHVLKFCFFLKELLNKKGIEFERKF